MLYITESEKYRSENKTQSEVITPSRRFLVLSLRSKVGDPQGERSEIRAVRNVSNLYNKLNLL